MDRHRLECDPADGVNQWHDQDGDGKGHVSEAQAEVGRFKTHHRAAAVCCRCSDEAAYRATTNHYNAVFATRNGTWHQVGNIERRWRTIRADTGFDWVTPHTFRKTVATLIDRLVDSDTAARVLGHSSDAITKEFYIEKDRTTPDVTHILQSFAGKATTTSSDD